MFLVGLLHLKFLISFMIINLTLMTLITLLLGIISKKLYGKEIYRELKTIAWHPLMRWDWFMPGTMRVVVTNIKNASK